MSILILAVFRSQLFAVFKLEIKYNDASAEKNLDAPPSGGHTNGIY